MAASLTSKKLNQEPSKTSLTMIEIFKKCVTSDFANFSGRARRQEYWMFYLASCIIWLVFYLLLIASAASGSGVLYGIVCFLNIVVSLALLIPSLAVTCRRLHDTGKSGLWLLSILACGIGGIIIFVFSLLDSDRGDNKYGADPKAAERA